MHRLAIANRLQLIQDYSIIQICKIPFGDHTSQFKRTTIFEDHDLRPILEMIGFRKPKFGFMLIWERSDEYKKDIVTAALFLLAGSHKV